MPLPSADCDSTAGGIVVRFSSPKLDIQRQRNTEGMDEVQRLVGKMI